MARATWNHTVLPATRTFIHECKEPSSLYSVSIHQMVPPQTEVANIWLQPTTDLSTPKRWRTCSRRFTDISSHQSAAGPAQDRKSLPAKDRYSTTVSRNQLKVNVNSTIILLERRLGNHRSFLEPWARMLTVRLLESIGSIKLLGDSGYKGLNNLYRLHAATFWPPVKILITNPTPNSLRHQETFSAVNKYLPTPTPVAGVRFTLAFVCLSLCQSERHLKYRRS